jgi:flagellar biosynthetic protein FliQ
VNADGAVGLLNQLLWQALLISLPLLAVTLLVGLAVSVLQVVTQMQDTSLSYVPKLLAAMLVLVLFGPSMLGRILSYASSLLVTIATLG